MSGEDDDRVDPSAVLVPLLVEVQNLLVDIKELLAPRSGSLPFNSGNVTISSVTAAGTYPSIQDIYAIFDAPLPLMQIVNDGPGKLFFIQIDGYAKVSGIEEELGVGDKRVLLNVYEVRARTDMPLTQYRLVEGEIFVASSAKNYKINTETRPTLANNEKLKVFAASFDNSPALIPIVPPLPALYLGPSFHAPLAAGVTQQLTDLETAIDMPYRIASGYILEAFAVLAALTTNFTIRGYYEFPAGSGFYNLSFVLPGPARMSPLYLLNLNLLSTAAVDPNGAPAVGRGILFTITNDDAAATMIGEFDIELILRRVA